MLANPLTAEPVFVTSVAIGSLRATVSAQADLMSEMCARSAVPSSASPLTSRVAEASQLALAVAEPSQEAWHSAAPSQFSLPSQDGSPALMSHFPWHSPLHSALPSV